MCSKASSTGSASAPGRAAPCCPAPSPGCAGARQHPTLRIAVYQATAGRAPPANCRLVLLGDNVKPALRGAAPLLQHDGVLPAGDGADAHGGVAQGLLRHRRLLPEDGAGQGRRPAIQGESLYHNFTVLQPLNVPFLAAFWHTQVTSNLHTLQGVSASMIGAVPYSALRFGAYDGLKVLYRRVSSKEHLALDVSKSCVPQS